MWLHAILLTPYLAIGSGLMLAATVAFVCATQTEPPGRFDHQ